MAVLLSVLVAIGFVRRQVFAFQSASAPMVSIAPAYNGHRGMPTLSASPQAGMGRAHSAVGVLSAACIELARLRLATSLVDLAERRQSTGSNRRHVGRIEGDYLFGMAARWRWIADFIVMRRSGGAADRVHADLERARAAPNAAGVDFPLVAKPDIGCQGYGVRRIDDP